MGKSKNPLLEAALPGLISVGGSLFGGLLDDSDERAEKLERDKLKQQRELGLKGLALEERGLNQRKAEADQDTRFKGLNYLAEQRMAASNMARKTKFRDALYQAAAKRPTVTAGV